MSAMSTRIFSDGLLTCRQSNFVLQPNNTTMFAFKNGLLETMIPLGEVYIFERKISEWLSRYTKLRVEWGNVVRLSACTKRFPFHSVQESDGSHSVSCPMGTEGYGSNSISCPMGTEGCGSNSVSCPMGTEVYGSHSVSCPIGTEGYGSHSVSCPIGTEGYGSHSVSCPIGTKGYGSHSVSCPMGTAGYGSASCPIGREYILNDKVAGT